MHLGRPANIGAAGACWNDAGRIWSRASSSTATPAARRRRGEKSSQGARIAMRSGIGVDRVHAEHSGVADWAAERPSGRSLKALQLALQKTTEVLASELCNPTAAAPAWSEAEWAVARAVAAIHGVSPLLADTLRWQGPVAWARFLAEQKAHTAQRFQRIEQLLQHMD